MKSAVAILTYNRLHALQVTLGGLRQHVVGCPVAVFEDCGQRDPTESWLKGGAVPRRNHRDLMATEYENPSLPGIQVFLGNSNLGVTGNSNRALRWFQATGCDHLCLLNDDLHVLGDFVSFYAKGHADLDVGLFCFCDFVHHESYRWMTVNSRGYRVKLLPRMTGIMMSLTRKVVDKIGFYDARFGRFGEEHCDYTIRARLAGFVSLDGQMQNCLDLETNTLKHQEVETSVTGPERLALDKEASIIMAERCKNYGREPLYQPFVLRLPRQAGGDSGSGIPVGNLDQYAQVDCPA